VFYRANCEGKASSIAQFPAYVVVFATWLWSKGKIAPCFGKINEWTYCVQTLCLCGFISLHKDEIVLKHIQIYILAVNRNFFSGHVCKIANSDYQLRHVLGPSVRPSARMEKLGSQWTDFMKFDIWVFLEKSVAKIQVSL